MKNIFLVLFISTFYFCFVACDDSSTNKNDQKSITHMSYRELGEKADDAIKKGKNIEAELLFQKMLKYQLSTKNPRIAELGTIYYFLGQVTQDKNNFKKATPYIKKALKLEANKAIPDKREIAGYYYLLGRIALTYTANNEAISYLEESKKLLILQENKKQDNINTYFYLTIGYYREKQLVKALENIQKGTDLSKKINGLKSSSTASCQGMFAKILYGLKRHQEAIDVLKKAHVFFVKHRGENNKTTKKLALLLKKWETSLKLRGI